ncbi:MAG TPA: GTPase domain-containing protein [Phycisphaerales bacterium]|nr:GTPase domain-containing protein [Phycisphaerales bacterium]HMP37937.1 GTPase domain-containing protein [Phycisphaerales bacterium]
MSERLRLAIVGHTNSGKTSLARTLARNARFGIVDSEPSTTRDAETILLRADGLPLAELVDTPGLEDPIRLRDHLHAIATGPRDEGPGLIDRFLASPEAAGRFLPEAIALRALLEAHAGLYVVDARDEVQPKHRDELYVLRRCRRPLLATINFAATEEGRRGAAAWREAFADAGLDEVAEVDACRFDLEAEQDLYRKLAAKLDRFRPTLDRLAGDRARRARDLRRIAARNALAVAVEASALAESVPRDDEAAATAARLRLVERVRTLERRAATALLGSFAFPEGDLEPFEVDQINGGFGYDVLHIDSVKRRDVLAGAGTGAVAGVAAGAAIGAKVEAVTGWIAPGASTTLLGLGGLVVGGATPLRRALVRRLRGLREFSLDESDLATLVHRQLDLARRLLRRGHASLQPIVAPPRDISRSATPAEREAVRSALRAIRAKVPPDPDRPTASAASHERLIERLSSALANVV